MTSEEHPDVVGAPARTSGAFERWFRTPAPRTGSRRLLLTLLVVGVALALRLVHLDQLAGTPWEDERGLISDSQYYDLRAKEIASGDWVGRYPGFLSPLYCYVLGGAYLVTGGNVFAVKVLQVLCASLAIGLAHRVARRATSEVAALVAGLALAAYGPLVYYSTLFLPTTLVFGLHALLLWVVLRGAWTARRALAAGLLVGLAIGAKANALLLLPALGLWSVRETGLRGGARTAWPLAALVLGAAIAVAPITWRNWATSGEVVLVTTTGGRNLLKGNGEQATGTHTQLNQETVHIGHYLEGEVDVARAVAEDDELAALAWRTMLDDPGRALGLFVTKLRLFFNAAELGIRDDYNFARTQTPLLGTPLIGFAWLVPLGLVGLVLWTRCSRGAELLALVLLTQVASFVLVFVLARYRVVALLCLAPLAGQALVGFVADLWERRLARAVVALLLLVPATLFVVRPVPGFERPNPPGELHRFVADWHFAREEWREAFAAYNLAVDSAWHISTLNDHWEVRARIADCYDGLRKPQKADRVRETLLKEIKRQYPIRPMELKDELAEKLERTRERGED